MKSDNFDNVWQETKKDSVQDYTESELLKKLDEVREQWKSAEGTREECDARCQSWVDGLWAKHIRAAIDNGVTPCDADVGLVRGAWDDSVIELNPNLREYRLAVAVAIARAEGFEAGKATMNVGNSNKDNPGVYRQITTVHFTED